MSHGKIIGVTFECFAKMCKAWEMSEKMYGFVLRLIFHDSLRMAGLLWEFLREACLKQGLGCLWMAGRVLRSLVLVLGLWSEKCKFLKIRGHVAFLSELWA